MRAVVGLLVVMATVGVAHAGKIKVRIESDPAGAAVYLDSTENSPACKETPCTVEVIADQTVIYVQKENYTPELVTADGTKKTLKVTLKKAVGTISIEGADGARITIDDEDKGKAPDKLELGEGAYHVVVTGKDGSVLYDQIVEVKAGEEVTVEPEGGGGGGGKPDPEEGPKDKPEEPEKPRTHDRYVQGSVVMDVGFREFRYENNKTAATLLDENEGGQVLLGPMIELWPTEILGLGKLRGLSLMGRVGFNVNPQPVTQKGMNTGLTTFWQAIEVLLRHRWSLGSVAIEVHGGYGQEQYRFNGSPDQIALVPDAQYASVKLGARAGILIADTIEPYLVVENRIVLSGGAIEERFMRGADASGLHGALGAMARFGSFAARVEGDLTRYSWTFNSQNGDTRQATGGTDLISVIQVSLGYSY